MDITELDINYLFKFATDQILIKHNITPAIMAEQLDININTLYSYRNGNRSASFEIIYQTVHVYKLNPCYFFFKNEPLFLFPDNSNDLILQEKKFLLETIKFFSHKLNTLK